jgi:hypothetical protein
LVGRAAFVSEATYLQTGLGKVSRQHFGLGLEVGAIAVFAAGHTEGNFLVSAPSEFEMLADGLGLSGRQPSAATIPTLKAKQSAPPWTNRQT